MFSSNTCKNNESSVWDTKTVEKKTGWESWHGLIAH